MKPLPAHITTVSGSIEFRLKEKGSLFIAEVFHVEMEADVHEILIKVRKKYYDSTHNCYAYKFADESFKYSDDGEPSGTAGIRILNAINHENLFNVLVIVTRYFGGTKLGIGPLGKAYYEAAVETLIKIDKKSQQLHTKTTIKYDYEFSNLVHRLISNFSAKIEKTNFDGTPNISCLIPTESIKQFAKELELGSLSKIKVEVSNLNEYI
ncbi:MAG: YigZ family protein [Melioribacteraceae bacterium]|nr:YigZ family protein [Melioribacteraceae bacterium]